MKKIQIFKFHLEACRIEPRYIERGFRDISQNKLDEIYIQYVIPLHQTWTSLTPVQWTVLDALIKGSDEKRILYAQRKALRIAWKGLIKNESKTNKETINGVSIQPENTGTNENSQ